MPFPLSLLLGRLSALLLMLLPPVLSAVDLVRAHPRAAATVIVAGTVAWQGFAQRRAFLACLHAIRAPQPPPQHRAPVLVGLLLGATISAALLGVDLVMHVDGWHSLAGRLCPAAVLAAYRCYCVRRRPASPAGQLAGLVLPIVRGLPLNALAAAYRSCRRACTHQRSSHTSTSA